MDFCLHGFLHIAPVPGAYEGQNGGIGSSGTGVTNSCEQPCAADKHACSGRAASALNCRDVILALIFFMGLIPCKRLSINPFFPQKASGVLVKMFSLFNLSLSYMPPPLALTIMINFLKTSLL